VPHAELVGPVPDGAEPLEYDRLRRRLLWAMPHGLYLLSSASGEARNLMTVSLATQVATSPKLLGVSVERDSRTLELIEGSGRFALVLLGRGSRGEIRRFVKPAAHDPDARTLSGAPYREIDGGLPIPDFAAGYLACALTASHDYGSHRFVVGEVVDAGLSPEGEGALAELLRMEDTKMSYGG
jgi:flavin reductase (DIM6/NTAB) family NADH-FMN oxidoreductase RutF